MDEIFRLIQGSEKLPEDEPSEGAPQIPNPVDRPTEMMRLSIKDTRFLQQFMEQKNWSSLRQLMFEIRSVRGVIGRLAHTLSVARYFEYQMNRNASSQEPGLFAERGSIDDYFEYYGWVFMDKPDMGYMAPATHNRQLDEIWIPAHPQYNCQCV